MSEARYKNTFAHDSFLGWLNIFKFKNTAHVLRPGERPPYPIIIADPTLSDVVNNLNKADLSLFLTTSTLGFFFARRSMGQLYTTEFLRRRGFSIAWNAIIMFSALLALANSNNRLTGQVDNGLVWKRRSEALKKYDFTSEWEKGTIWSFFKLREQ